MGGKSVASNPRMGARADLSLGSGRDPEASHDPVWLQANSGQAHSGMVVPTHPFFERMLSRMPLNVRQSLTAEQLAALSRASIDGISRHRIDYRVSFGVLGRRYYVTLLGGRERRSRERLLREGQIILSRLTVAYAALIAGLGTSVFLLVIVALYVVKSLLGIDLMQDYSAVNELFDKIR